MTDVEVAQDLTMDNRPGKDQSDQSDQSDLSHSEENNNECKSSETTDELASLKNTYVCNAHINSEWHNTCPYILE
ncbi:hypothetical protein HNY73_014728 [Argiope bruennichi]|uniref:Uncharacterized protein n=1 Tax=Argiope bruennichi TaxID=94029 RepID=A0A8T0ER37_ARGBR|nr:hypothetical protein HNY73_014728 [Argiope bruennichi]